MPAPRPTACAASRSTTAQHAEPSHAAPPERRSVLADQPLPRRRHRRRTRSACSATTSACTASSPTGPADYTAVEPATGCARAGGRQPARRRDEHAQLLPHRRLPDRRSAGQQVRSGATTSSAAAGTPTSRLSSPASATKLLAALAGLDADIIGLNELENTTGVEPLAEHRGRACRAMPTSTPAPSAPTRSRSA